MSPSFQRPRRGQAEEPISRARRLSSVLFELSGLSDEAAEIHPDAWQALRLSGLLMAPWPSLHGGEDLLVPGRHRTLFDLLRLIGGSDLSIGRLYEGHVNAVTLVCRYGTPDQISRGADAVRAGGMMGVWAAEDKAGLRATRIEGAVRLEGGKILASGAGILVNPVVTASSEAGQIMLLPRLRPGERADISGWTAQGMRATATGSVDLSGLSFSEAEVLGQPGDFMRQPYFSGGAWRFCAVHLGAMERLVDLFRHHLTSKRRDTDPYQIQRVAHCVAAAGTAAFWVAEAARRMAEVQDEVASLVAFVNLTRMVTERAALDVLETVHRGVGLGGFVRPHPIERVSRDLSTYLRQPVPDLAMADAARTVLASEKATGDLWGAALES